jgi:hypothetical protein
MINDLHDLKKLLVVLRKNGVLEMELGTLKLKMGELPSVSSVSESQDESIPSNFPLGELTPEQLMFYSAGGHPDDDPALKGQNN